MLMPANHIPHNKSYNIAVELTDNFEVEEPTACLWVKVLTMNL